MRKKDDATKWISGNIIAMMIHCSSFITPHSSSSFNKVQAYYKGFFGFMVKKSMFCYIWISSMQDYSWGLSTGKQQVDNNRCPQYAKRRERCTCASVNLTPGAVASPERSWSMYSNTRYRFPDILDVTKASSFMTFGWSSLRKMHISLAMKRTLSGSKLTNLTFFIATILLFVRSRALYTLLYVPWPICTKFTSELLKS